MVKYARYILLILLSAAAVTFAFLFIKNKQADNSPQVASSIIDPGYSYASILGKNYSVKDLLADDLEKIDLELDGLLKKKLIEKYSLTQNATDDYHPSKKEVFDFYKQYKLEKEGPIEILTPRIADYLEKQHKDELVENSFSDAVAKGDIVLNYKPSAFKYNVNMLGKKPVSGEASNRVVLLEFTDLQCPFCKAYQSTLAQLMKEYSGRVSFYFFHFPLDIHQGAVSAANALECAGEQGDLLQFKATLFNNQGSFNDDGIAKLASGDKNIDLAKFKKCYSEKKYQKVITTDLAQAKSLNLTGTPTLFVGKINDGDHNFTGDIVVGNQPVAQFRTLLNSYLSAE